VAVLCVPVLIVLVWLIKNLVFLLYASTTNFFFNLMLPVAACVLAVGVAVLANPMHALLSLVGVFLSTVLFYVQAGIVFIGLAFLIVYVGAVAILFLFVIMLLNVKSLTSKARVITHRTQTIALFFGALLGYRLFTGVASSLGRATFKSTAQRSHVGGVSSGIDDVIYYQTMFRGPDVNAIAPLYTEHALLFGVTTANLLLALIGAIVLATSTTEQTVKLVPVTERTGSASSSAAVLAFCLLSQEHLNDPFIVHTMSFSTLLTFSSIVITVLALTKHFNSFKKPKVIASSSDGKEAAQFKAGFEQSGRFRRNTPFVTSAAVWSAGSARQATTGRFVIAFLAVLGTAPLLVYVVWAADLLMVHAEVLCSLVGAGCLSGPSPTSQ